jgi:hypothetical protein
MVGGSNLIFLKRVFFGEFSDVTHTHIAAILKIFCSVKMMYCREQKILVVNVISKFG